MEFRRGLILLAAVLWVAVVAAVFFLLLTPRRPPTEPSLQEGEWFQGGSAPFMANDTWRVRCLGEDIHLVVKTIDPEGGTVTFLDVSGDSPPKIITVGVNEEVVAKRLAIGVVVNVNIESTDEDEPVVHIYSYHQCRKAP